MNAFGVVIRIIQEHRGELAERFGVRSLALFGSVARDQATDASDIDLLVEFSRPTGYLGLVGLQLHLQELLGPEVDLRTPGGLRPSIRDRVVKEAIRVA